MVRYLYNLESLPQGCFVSSLIEIGKVVLEKKIPKICQHIFTIGESSSLQKGHSSLFEQN